MRLWHQQLQIMVVTFLYLVLVWMLFMRVFRVTKFLILCIFPDIVAAAVLSGNRNFEGRVHPLTRANYLASPPLVVAYALAGTVCCFYRCKHVHLRSISLIWRHLCR